MGEGVGKSSGAGKIYQKQKSVQTTLIRVMRGLKRSVIVSAMVSWVPIAAR